MRRNAALAVALLAAVGLGGCSLFGSSEDKTTPEAAVPADPFVLVAKIDRIEIGRTRNGIAATAFGTAPGLGYGAPELRPRRDGKVGTDGFLDYDFVARPPDPGFALGEGSPQARAIRADILLSPNQLQGARGLRVHAAVGGLQVVF